MHFIQVAAIQAIAVFIAVCNAVPTQQAHVLHEERSTTPREWQRGSRVDGAAMLPVRIGLVQSNLEKGDGYLMDVSHPSSPNYGKHWTAEAVHDMFAPSDDAVKGVMAWLEQAGVVGVVHSDNKGWIAFDAPASQVEELFQTRYYEHSHKSSSTKVKIGSDDYYVPEHLALHIDYVTPGVTLSHPLVKRTHMAPPSYGKGHGRHPTPYKQPKPVPHQWQPPHHPQLPANLQDCGRNITPACIKALYTIPNAPVHVSDVDALGFFEGLNDKYAQSDLNSFFAKYAPNVPQGTHPKLDSVDGGQAPVAADDPDNTGESEADLQVAYSLIYPQRITLYQVEDEIQAPYTQGFNNFLDAVDGSYCTYSAYGITGNSPGIDLTYPDPAPGGYKGQLNCGTYKPTRVVSVSYFGSESDTPRNYLRRQCNEFMKLGLQGTTFLFISGDYGVGIYPGDPTPSGCLGDDETIYNPTFATCPYVTVVGGTQLYDSQTVLDRESALDVTFPDGTRFTSGGGFSNYFPAPSYQKNALSTYFSRHDPGHPYYKANYNQTDVTNLGQGGGIYNRAGRGYPDVSANGANLHVFINSTDFQYYGTSISSPIFASIVTLINQERTNAGKGPVGFINPVLYQNAWALNDIVNGSNPGCGSSGFKAVPGWDPVTGLGTPSYPKLLKLFMSLP